MSHKLGGENLKDFYKLDKYLFEDEKYKSLKLNSKIAYCILKDMIDENINIKIDSNGNKYIEDSRIYLMKKLDITKNTITSVYKELIKADLIEEKWVAVGKANIVCIKNWESKEKEENHNICEKEKENNRKFISVKEITSLDVIFANEFLNKVELKKFDFAYRKIEKNILWNQYTTNEKELIRIALKYITRKIEREKWDELLSYIDNDILQEALSELKQTKRNDYVFNIFIKIIYKLLKEYTK